MSCIKSIQRGTTQSVALPVALSTPINPSKSMVIVNERGYNKSDYYYASSPVYVENLTSTQIFLNYNRIGGSGISGTYAWQVIEFA